MRTNIIKKLLITWIGLTFFLCSYVPGQEVISWKDADGYYGEYVTVEGKIVDTHRTEKVCFLNFHHNYKKYFTAVIFSSDFDKFSNSPENYYLNKKVQVTGLIKEYKGAPEIVLKDPSNIKIIGEKDRSKKAKEISWEDADQHYGEYCSVKGKIVATYNSGKACFLNFHKNWKRYFTAVIFASDFDKFHSDPENYYLKKEVKVTGIIKKYQGKPEIVVKSPKQIEIIRDREL